MPPLYVVQQGAKLRISNRRLRIELEGEELANVPMAHVSQVVLFGRIGLTTPAIDALLASNKEVVFLTSRGDYRGRLLGEVTPHVPLRRAQYKHTGDPSFKLELAKCIVRAKLSHQRALLKRHNRQTNYPQISSASEQIWQTLQKLDRKTTLGGLRGLEGSGTRAFFSGYRRLFDDVWRFDGRNRRPPRDPVNVLLSFGYTLLTNLADSALQTVGLDPYAGFLHEVAYNRPALALDLVEEFRPVVDGVVLWCCRSGQIQPDDFSPGPAERPIVLEEAGQRRFIQAYEERLTRRFTHPLRGLQYPLRQCLIEQARQIADCIQKGEPNYQGMGFR